jgi:hypothetical protein
MKPSRTVLGAAVAAVLALGAAPAFATIEKITLTGQWVDNLETIAGAQGSAVTAYSKDGATFSVSFDIAQTFAFTTMVDGFTVPTTAPATDLSNFVYKLNGVVVPTTLSPVLAPDCMATGALCDVEFFSATGNQGGALGLDFGDHTVEFIGSDFGSTGTLNEGAYASAVNIDYTTDGFGNVINEGTSSITITPIPEPAAWALMMVGFGGVGGALRGAARKPRLA